MSKYKIIIRQAPGFFIKYNKNWKFGRYTISKLDFVFLKEFLVGYHGIKQKLMIAHRDNFLPALQYASAVGKLTQIFFKKGDVKSANTIDKKDKR